jgi:hypothetical protein
LARGVRAVITVYAAADILGCQPARVGVDVRLRLRPTPATHIERWVTADDVDSGEIDERWGTAM